MPQENPTPSWKSRLGLALRLAISLGLLTAIFLSIDLPRTADILRRARPLFIFLAGAMLLLQVFVSAYKLTLLVRCRIPAVRLPPMIRTVFISLFVGEFFPGSLGAEAARMIGIARHTADPALSFSAVLMDRLMGLTGMFTVVLLGILFDERGLLAGVTPYAVLGLALIVAAWSLAMTRPFRKVLDKLLGPRCLHLVRDKVQKVYECMDAFRRRPFVLLTSLLIAVFYNGIRALSIFFAARAVGINAPAAVFFIIVPLVVLAMQLPISIAGLGVREITYVAILQTTFQVPKESTLAMIFVIVTVGIIVELTPGAIFFMLARHSAHGNSPTASQTLPKSVQQPVQQ